MGCVIIKKIFQNLLLREANRTYLTHLLAINNYFMGLEFHSGRFRAQNVIM